ncbi:hypothetical protein M409DRAFT_54071 [Zasmidium cellare ATCC 36951]|uniref:Uncharacterized protein n=1 Tax=Zasmidium cellare ATCC 36951 TaxID=1080233 RepID=A0A6A6CNH6_ZASCE|nr:uncharacterized protein M409DRAFT_54071 [Zasmidium cellare ATCC 36951]KAF2167472.1 hypothetical protein M409DRAFT_54071 [Zasmidium cellare ATCC 36951]
MASSTQRTPTTFLSLPTEIRFKIYHLVCTPTEAVVIDACRLPPGHTEEWIFLPQQSPGIVEINRLQHWNPVWRDGVQSAWHDEVEQMGSQKLEIGWVYPPPEGKRSRKYFKKYRKALKRGERLDARIPTFFADMSKSRMEKLVEVIKAEGHLQVETNSRWDCGLGARFWRQWHAERGRAPVRVEDGYWRAMW